MPSKVLARWRASETEALSGHAVAGSSGAGLSAATAPTAAAVADAVWDELLADHAVAGSTGAGLTTASAGGTTNNYSIFSDSWTVA